MKLAAKKGSQAGTHKTYSGLCGILLPRPLHGEKDYAEAMEMIERLAGHELNAEQVDYLDALSKFVGDYEDNAYRIGTSHISPVDVLGELLNRRGMTASDLGRLLGSRTLGHAILTGRRELSKAHIAILSRFFRVKPGLFLSGEYPGLEKIRDKSVREKLGAFLSEERGLHPVDEIDEAMKLVGKLTSLIESSPHGPERAEASKIKEFLLRYADTNRP